MGEFVVPFGLDADGALVARAHAARGRPYRCPACLTLLIFRAGQFRRRHFAHQSALPEAAERACTPESAAHATAKILIRDAIRAHVVDPEASPILVLRKCLDCGKATPFPVSPETFLGAELEVRSGQRVIDVLAKRSDGSLLGIEIFHSHAVGAVKGMEMSILWLELRAADVLNDPRRWRPVAGRFTRKFRCRECLKERAQRRRAEAARRVAEQQHQAERARHWTEAALKHARLRMENARRFAEQQQQKDRAPQRAEAPPMSAEQHHAHPSPLSEALSVRDERERRNAAQIRASVARGRDPVFRAARARAELVWCEEYLRTRVLVKTIDFGYLHPRPARAALGAPEAALTMHQSHAAAAQDGLGLFVGDGEGKGRPG